MIHAPTERSPARSAFQASLWKWVIFCLEVIKVFLGKDKDLFACDGGTGKLSVCWIHDSFRLSKIVKLSRSGRGVWL